VATSVSSYVGALVTIQLLRKKVKTKWRGVPKLAELKPFLSVSGALLLSAVLVGFTYSMTTTVANSGGIIAEAASHQVTSPIALRSHSSSAPPSPSRTPHALFFSYRVKGACPIMQQLMVHARSCSS
jgi:hypothetical protein